MQKPGNIITDDPLIINISYYLLDEKDLNLDFHTSFLKIGQKLL